jgi:hypothetical protein
MTEDNKDLTRRDFMKFTGVAVGGAALANAPNLVRNTVDFLDPPGNPPFLKIEPRFCIDDHLPHSADIRPDTAIICGETSKMTFDIYYPNLEGKKITYSSILSNSPSTAVTSKGLEDETVAISRAIAQGTEMIGSDVTLNFSTDDNNLSAKAFEAGDEEALISTLSASCLTFIASITSLNAAFYLESKLSNGQKIETITKNLDPKLYSIVKNSLALSLGYAAGNALDRDKLLVGLQGLRTEIDKFFVGIKHKDLVRLYETIKQRSISMASNTIVALQILDGLPHKSKELKDKFPKPDIYFFAGGSHVAAKKYYKEGKLQREVAIFDTIDETFNECYVDLANSESEGPEAVKKSLEYWVHLTAGLSYPLASFMNNQEFINEDLSKINYSPRAHLWLNLLARAENDPQNKIIQKLVQRLVLEDTTCQDMYRDPLVPEITQRAKDDSKCQSIKKFAIGPENYELRITAGIPSIFKL